MYLGNFVHSPCQNVHSIAIKLLIIEQFFFSLQVLHPVANIYNMLVWRAMYCDPLFSPPTTAHPPTTSPSPSPENCSVSTIDSTPDTHHTSIGKVKVQAPELNAHKMADLDLGNGDSVSEGVNHTVGGVNGCETTSHTLNEVDGKADSFPVTSSEDVVAELDGDPGAGKPDQSLCDAEPTSTSSNTVADTINGCLTEEDGTTPTCESSGSGRDSCGDEKGEEVGVVAQRGSGGSSPALSSYHDCHESLHTRMRRSASTGSATGTPGGGNSAPKQEEACQDGRSSRSGHAHLPCTDEYYTISPKPHVLFSQQLAGTNATLRQSNEMSNGKASLPSHSSSAHQDTPTTWYVLTSFVFYQMDYV